MEGSYWLWGTSMMRIWIVILGAVIYLAVRLANEHSRRD
jgi:hypothetical protein